MSSRKILIVNFGGMGDILNTTSVAAHYKLSCSDIDVCFLTKSKYRQLLVNNSHIKKLLHLDDEFNDYPPLQLSLRFKRDIANSNLNISEYDKIIFPAPYMSPLYDGTARSRLLKIIKDESSGIKEWSCDFLPHVELSIQEKNEAKLFLGKLTKKPKIMIEYEFLSEQSFMDKNCILRILNFYKESDFNIIFSGKTKPSYLEDNIFGGDSNIFHYSGSFMSNAEIYNSLDLFIGCSSGITCLTSSDYCDPSIPRIELVKGEHWSTRDFTHHANKTIIYKANELDLALNKYQLKQ